MIPIDWQPLLLGSVLIVLHGLGVAALVYRLLPRDAPGRAGDALCLGAAASPVVAGLWTIGLFAAAGNRSDGVYVALHFGAALLVILLSARSLRELYGEVAARRPVVSWPDALRRDGLRLALLAFILLALTGLVLQVLFRPLIDNDPLEYALVGRALYGQRSFDAYPFVEADPVSGMFAPWTHPPLYPALIVLGHVIAGNADAPGLMRLVAPACLILTLLVLMRTMLRTQGERGWTIGLFTAAIVVGHRFLHTQIFGAAIDALPILGLSLTFAALCLSSSASPAARVAIAGTALGLAMWTHSEAILFPALVGAAIAAMRWSAGRPFLAECAGVLALGGVIGSPPYLRNITIFGAPVSDVPPVFALETLDWNAYFTAGRGLSSTYERITIGVLRGWTDSGFGLTFWIMTAGVIVLLAALRRSRNRTPAPEWSLPFAGATAIVVTHQLGMLASLLVGSYEMIKNPRYLLPIVPLAALLAGLALDRLSAAIVRQRRLPFPAGLAVIASMVILAMHTMPLLRRYESDAIEAIVRGVVRVPNPADGMQTYMRETLPDHAVILALRPADMYYGRHRMVSWLDSRLIPAYREPDPQKLAALLDGLGVTHILRLGYSLPTISDTALQALLADTSLTRFLNSAGRQDLFELKDAASRRTASVPAAPLQVWDLSPSARHPWTGVSDAVLVGAGIVCRTAGITVESSVLLPTVRRCSLIPVHLARYTSPSAGATEGTEGAERTGGTLIQGGTMYRYTARLSGQGYVRLLINEKRQTGALTALIDEGSLTATERTLTRIIRLGGDVTGVSFEARLQGHSALRILDFRLEALPD